MEHNHNEIDTGMSTLSWRDDRWLATFPLNNDTVLSYVSGSPFWERGCDNDIVAMQELDLSVIDTMDGVQYVVEPVELKEHLKQMMNFSLFVIRKQKRNLEHRHHGRIGVLGEAAISTLGYLYVLGGIVYSAPDLLSVISCRLKKSLADTREAFQTVSSHVKYTPNASVRYDWKREDQQKPE